MCRKTIYYNTYGDGSEDVTERVDTCRPGKMCAYPERKEYQRQFRFTKLGGTSSPETPVSLADRRPTPYATDFLELPPTPRSKSPSPSRKRESGVYINGEKIANIHAPRKSEKRRNHVVVHAPEPPSPIRPAAIKRHSTMPADYVVIENEAAGRGRHGGRHSSTTRRNSSRDIPVGFAGILDDMGSRHSSPSRRSASPRPLHYREHARTARGFEYVDSERAERRKSRRSSSYHHYPTTSSSSRPVEDVYLSPAASPPTPTRKEVHFTTTGVDPARESAIRRQNERIARRPKLHQEVKGILKKDSSGIHPQVVVPDNEYDELRRAVGQMDIQKVPDVRREYSDPQYWDRLRGRFEEPRERRRKSRVLYPGETVYKYM
ncbi:hypothetical protein GE09DRAFT_1159747 [Coniochaeta sp. 2T2.1]|nr:hypothetical protein GE09DRAFT_1159747 [Coniochaeta sp. 2T2.1]